ncbi:MAG TPA: glycogen debranching N-terminal domain-containing protein [Steroidobacteraceae bacterium]|nr:glycogen debranching N-terminal domain-containing protein [Steroidobacteraceae bacterium]
MAITPDQHEAREHSLTQHHAARLRIGVDAIVLKFDDTFLLSDFAGDVGGSQGQGVGLFYRDTRYLSLYELSLDDQRLIALSSEHGGGDWVSHALENQALQASEDDPHSLAVRRYRTAGDGELRELLLVSNYARHATPLCLRLRFEADFADIFEVRSLARSQPPQERGVRTEAHSVCLWARGRDQRVRSTTLSFSPAPSRLEAACASFELQLDAGETRRIELQILLHESEPGGAGEARPPGSTRRPPLDPARLHEGTESQSGQLLEGATRLQAHPTLETLLRRSLMDLAILRCRLRSDLQYIAAGVPWYVTLFGRDSALCALQLCAWRASIAGDTLRLLARTQAREIDRYRDAQPGKILHELRRGQLSRLKAIPQSPTYYGSIDSTLLFIILLGEYLDWSADLATIRELRGNLEAALTWIEQFGDSDGDGYLDYGGDHPSGSRYHHGLVNQGWKDSGDAIVNADGSLVEPPVALCEVQGYLYRAWHSAARLLRQLGETARSADLERRAAALRERFERDFWSADLDCYVLARQHGGRAAAVLASNAGQVLWSGIPSSAHAAAVAQRLMQPDMFSGWGVRTLSSREQRFNPLSYHLGSVWPHDNSIICAGFRRYGQNDAALRIFDALCDAARGFRNQRMPELYCGFERGAEESHPVPYPVACSPQAWAAGAIPYALTSLLGLTPDACANTLRVIDPILPEWLSRLQLTGLRVGDAQVDLTFERDAHGTLQLDSKLRCGTLHIERASNPAVSVTR